MAGAALVLDAAMSRSWNRKPVVGIKIPAEDVTGARNSEACKIDPSCIKQASPPSARAKPLITRRVAPPCSQMLSLAVSSRDVGSGEIGK